MICTDVPLRLIERMGLTKRQRREKKVKQRLRANVRSVMGSIKNLVVSGLHEFMTAREARENVKKKLNESLDWENLKVVMPPGIKDFKFKMEETDDEFKCDISFTPGVGIREIDVDGYREFMHLKGWADLHVKDLRLQLQGALKEEDYEKAQEIMAKLKQYGDQ